MFLSISMTSSSEQFKRVVHSTDMLEVSGYPLLSRLGLTMARLGFLASILSALVALAVVQAVPLNATLGERAEGLSPVARDVLLSARAVPTSPRWVAYFDRFISSSSLPAVSALSVMYNRHLSRQWLIISS
jgi:hypothetical protein